MGEPIKDGTFSRQEESETADAKQIAANCLSESTPLLGSLKERSGKELMRSVNFLHAFAYMVSLLFGCGVFISPGLIAKQSSNMGMALVIWVLSGIPSILGALCYVELACMLRKTGGRYLFILEAFGESLGFFAIWTQLFVTTPASFAVLSIAAGEHFVQPYYDIKTPEGLWMVKGIAFGCLILTVIINCTNTTFVSKTQVLFTATQTIAVVFLIIVGIWKVATGHVSNYVHMFDNTDQTDVGKLGLALYDGFWAYGAWGTVGSVTEELQDLHRDLYLSVVTGFPFVIGCYVLVNLAFMSALSHEQIANSSTVAATFIEAALGKNASLVIPVAVGLSCFGTINAAMFVMSRVLLSAAREGQMPGHFSYIHKYKRTPIPATMFFFFLSFLWVIFSGYGTEKLITYYSLAMWITHIPAILAVIVLRIRKPDAYRPIKVWLVIPVITTIMATFLVILPFIQVPVESSICLVVLLIAFPVYYLCFKKQYELPSLLIRVNQYIYSVMERRLNLVPCIYKERGEIARDVSI